MEVDTDGEEEGVENFNRNFTQNFTNNFSGSIVDCGQPPNFRQILVSQALRFSLGSQFSECCSNLDVKNRKHFALYI